MAIYMKLDGVTGSVTAKGHEGKVGLETIDFGCSRDISMEVGKCANRDKGLPRFNELSCVKDIDDASPTLLKMATGKAKGKGCEILICSSDTSKPEDYVKYKLKDAVVSNYNLSSAGEKPVESFTLSYTDVEVTFKPSDKAGSGGGQAVTGYDLASATAR